MNIDKYLGRFFKGTKNPSLKAMRHFMKKYNNPEKELKVIHIAGTNGKGSCTEMISNILVNDGYKVGKFMSPHLIKYNERISINNKSIEDCEMEEIIKELDPLIIEYNNEYNTKVTLFELETIMAILYFYRNKCDFVILEVGLGGLYDCTNIVNPIVSIINSIGYDHMNILGNTLEEIAIQKAGIIKENSNTVFVEQESDVNKVIKNICKEKNNKLYLIKKEDIKNYSYDENFQKFDYKNYKNILINLKGKKQIYNASICLETVNILRKKYTISECAVRNGLKTVVHKARFEKINDNPTIIYDGAHNEPAIKNLKNSINMYYKNNKKVYIISILKTKDYCSVLKHLITNEEDIFIFTSGNDNEIYVSKEELYKEAETLSKNKNLYMEELVDAIDIVKEKYKECIIFIVGSFYIYGTVINRLKA